MLNIVKLSLLSKKEVPYNLNGVRTPKHFPSSIREWNNSIYVYNKSNLNLIPSTTTTAIRIIKNYFLLYNYDIEKKIRTERLLLRFRRLSSNKIYISNGEFKHTNNKVIVNLYLFNRQKHNYLLALKRLYLKTIFSIKDKNKFKLKSKKNDRFNKIAVKKASINSRINKFNIYKSRNIKLFKVMVLKKQRNIKLNIFKQKNITFNKIIKLSNWKDFKFNKLKNIKFNKYKSKCIEHNIQKRNNKIIKSTKFNKFLIKRINLINKRGLYLLKLINKEKYLIIKALKKNKKESLFISAYINDFYKNFVKKSLRKLQLYFYYRQLLYINKSKYNYNYLQYLSKFLHSIYNKNIEYNLINLKRFYLHSDILSESIRLKLTKNRKRILKKLDTIKKKVKIKDSKKFLGKKIFSKRLDYKINSIILPNSLKKNIIDNLKYKGIAGFRLEVKGRLTRRYTASRSVLKIKYKGNLLDLNSSHKGLSTVLLRGNLKSNLQYTKLKSRSRIGSFGIKGWVSGN